MATTLHSLFKSTALATALAVMIACAPALAATAGGQGGSPGGTPGGQTGGTPGGQTGGTPGGQTGGTPGGQTGGTVGGTTGGQTGGTPGATTGGSTGATTGGQTGDPTGGQTGAVASVAPAAPAGGLIRRDELVSGRCGVALELPDARAFVNPGDGAVAVSHATKSFVRDCSCDTQTCIADALDGYAAALAAVAPRLRPELRELPAVVARAATRVRAAHSKAAAVAILRETAATVHKAIALIRAPDPDTIKLGTRSGDVVSDALNVAALSLERSRGI